MSDKEQKEIDVCLGNYFIYHKIMNKIVICYNAVMQVGGIVQKVTGHSIDPLFKLSISNI